MSDLTQTTFQKREYSKQNDWQEITKEDYESIVGLDMHADKLQSDMGVQMDSYFNERFGEQVIPKKRLKEKIDEAHDQTFKNRSVGFMEKGKRAKSAKKKISLQRHIQKEQHTYIDMRNDDRKQMMRYCDRSKVENIDAVNEVYRSQEEKEALQEWLIGVDSHKNNKINYGLLSSDEDVRVKEYKHILKEVGRINVRAFAYSSDKEFASKFAAKYNVLSKAAAAGIFYYKLADYQETHPDDQFPMRKLQAKLLVLQELKEHYEEKMALLGSPYYALMSESDLERYSGASGERKLRAEVTSDSFKAYVRSYRRISESDIGKGKNLDSYLREKEQILETTYQRNGQFEDLEPGLDESIGRLLPEEHEENPDQQAAEEEKKYVNMPNGNEPAEEKAMENPYRKAAEEEKKYVNTPTGDEPAVEKVMENPYRKAAEEEKKYVNTPTGDEPAVEKVMENPYRKAAEEEEKYVNTPTGDEPSGEKAMENPYRQKLSESRILRGDDQEEDDFRLFHEDEFIHDIDEVSIGNLGKNYIDTSDDDISGLDEEQSRKEGIEQLEKSQREKTEWDADDLQEVDEMGVAIADEDAKELLDEDLDASLELDELKKSDFADGEDNDGLDVEQTLLRQKEDQTRLESERVEREAQQKEQEERQRAEEERQRAEEERQRAEEERQREEEERQRAKEEEQRESEKEQREEGQQGGHDEEARSYAEATMAVVERKLRNNIMLNPEDKAFLISDYMKYFTEDFRELADKYKEEQDAKKRAKKAKKAKIEQEERERIERERIEAERIERERIEAERIEQERIEAEREKEEQEEQEWQEEQERIEQEEQERIEQEEQERIEQEGQDEQEKDLETRVVQKFRNNEEMSPEEDEYLNAHLKEVFNKALIRVDPMSDRIS